MIDLLTSYGLASAMALYNAFLGLIPVAAFFGIIALVMRGGKVLSDLRRIGPETHINLMIMSFNVVFVVPLIVAASTIISTFIADKDLAVIDPAFWSKLPMPVVIIAGVAIGDFTGYWRHRLEHTKLLWPSHAVHHSDTEMTWLTVERFHPINRVTTFFIDNVVLFLLGMPAYAIVANGLVRHYYGAFVHADLPWTYGPLGRIFVSPAMHRWHHAADIRAFDTNYASVFSFIDQWFGTYRVPGPCTVRLGVTHDMGKGLAGQLSYAFRIESYRDLFGKKPKPAPRAATSNRTRSRASRKKSPARVSRKAGAGSKRARAR